MHVAFLVYLLTLGAIIAIGAKTRHLCWGPALVAIFLLIWARNLILTAQLLSPFNAIRFTGAYIVVSVAIAAAISAGLRLGRPMPNSASSSSPTRFHPGLPLHRLVPGGVPRRSRFSSTS